MARKKYAGITILAPIEYAQKISEALIPKDLQRRASELIKASSDKFTAFGSWGVCFVGPNVILKNEPGGGMDESEVATMLQLILQKTGASRKDIKTAAISWSDAGIKALRKLL